MKLYLIDNYTMNESDQKQMDIGIAVVQIGFYFTYSYLVRLNQNMELLRSFNFLFLVGSKYNIYRYYSQHYNLGKKETDKFVAKFNFFLPLMRPIMAFYNTFLAVGLLRCLYHSYHYVRPAYFFTACLLFALISAIDYLMLAFFLTTGFTMVYLSCELLILRLKAINKRISKQFLQMARPTSNPIRVRRQKTRKILFILNDFIGQFTEINSILDSLMSRVIFGLYVKVLQANA